MAQLKRGKLPNGSRYRLSFVTIHDDYAFPALLFDNDLWNGWAVPYFPLDVAKEVAERITENNRDFEDYRCVMTFDAETKTFTCVENSTAETQEERDESTWKASAELTIDGVDYYCLGGYSWTWTEVEPSYFCPECRRIHELTVTRRTKCEDCKREARMAARSRA